MAVQFPSPTRAWRNTPYPSIDPGLDRLSARDKTVIVTGAGANIGRAIAIAFAQAGAKHVALLGRTRATLESTATMIAGMTETSVHEVSVTDENGLKIIAARIGTWHIMVLNAAKALDTTPMMHAATEDWWSTFETNVKGTMLMIKGFLSYATTEDPTILSVSTGMYSLPPEAQYGHTEYSASKMAQTVLMSVLGSEEKHLHLRSFHPGIIRTEKTPKEAENMPFDDIALPGNFAVWLASKEAAFLDGKVAWANWDVDELKERANEIKNDPFLFTPNLVGWPFSPKPVR